MCSALPSAVDPSGKYQLADVVLWQGATDHPVDPCTACETATPPPATVTVEASHEPDERLGNDGAITPRAGTETAECTVAPESETDVTSATTACTVVFESTGKPGAAPEATDCPAQYHADDSASGGLTSEAGTASVARRSWGPTRARHDTDDHDHRGDDEEHRPAPLRRVVGGPAVLRRAHDALR